MVLREGGVGRQSEREGCDSVFIIAWGRVWGVVFEKKG
jgi:hypothetical protein